MRKSFVFLVAAGALALGAEGAWADTAFDIGKHSQAAVGAACTKAGGTSWGIGLNGQTYGCDKKNCDGKGGSCTVVCHTATNECSGSTPGRTTPPPGKYDLVKVLRYSPGRPPEHGLLEPSPGAPTHGPSRPGAPKPTVPPAGKLY